MTSTTIAALISLLEANDYQQVAEEMDGNTATYVFVRTKDEDFVTITGPVDHVAEVEEFPSAHGFLAHLVARADCGCVYHAEQGIPCEHDLALAHRNSFAGSLRAMSDF